MDKVSLYEKTKEGVMNIETHIAGDRKNNGVNFIMRLL